MPFEDVSSWSSPWVSGYIGFDRSLIIGISWNSASSSPTLSHIDVDGNTITTPSEIWFNSHQIFSKIWRCSLTAYGVETLGSNARGDGLTLTSGNIMTRFPRHYIKCDLTGTNKKWWISPFPWDGFVSAYAFSLRGNSLVPAENVYVGSYMAGASGGTTSANSGSNTLKATSWTNLVLTSRSGSTILAGDGSTSGNITEFETAANLIGTGWGIVNIHTWAMVRLLAYIRLGTLNVQSAVGAGRTNAANTSALTNGSVAAKEDVWGRSSGTSNTEGISLFGLENLWGNCWQHVIGYNTTDTEHRIVKRDGTGTLAGTLTSGNYDAITNPVPLNGTTNVSGTDEGAYCYGYTSAIIHDTNGMLDHLMMPSALSGTSSTYFSDDFSSHQSGLSKIGALQVGGAWSSVDGSGISAMSLFYQPTSTITSLTSRLEYIG